VGKFAGSWKTVGGFGSRDTLLKMDRLNPSGEDFTLSITISGAAECGGGDLTGSSKGNADGYTMPVDWVLSCTSGGSGAGSAFQAQYTYDPASGRLKDAQGGTYTRQ
jgi:hypothetical protein